jgi:ADP-ribose pyrophosphatase YjhB (NUDIX family)
VPEDVDQEARWQVFGKRQLYDSPWVRLALVDVESSDGRRFSHHVVQLKPIVVALVLDDQGRVLMLRRHRFIPDVVGWELPGGFVEDGELWGDAAIRETEEETGWRPIGPPEQITTFYSTPGILDSQTAIYLFRGALRVGEPTDGDEAGQVAWLSLDKVVGLIMQGTVLGAGPLVGLLYVLAAHPGDLTLRATASPVAGNANG